LAAKGLLEKARSPRLTTRLVSIRAMEKLPVLSENAEKALLEDIVNNPYTTAYISARILGNHGCTNAVPLLRELTSSDDYMLAGEAIIALAKMKDETFLPNIEKIIIDTENPRLTRMGAEALGIYHNPDSLKVLLDIIRSTESGLKSTANRWQYLIDEVVLAMSAILDTQNRFYKILVRYIENNLLVTALCVDEVESALEFYKSALVKKKKKNFKVIEKAAGSFQSAVLKYIQNNDGQELSHWVQELPDNNNGNKNIIKTVLSQAVLDNELGTHDRLRLLIVNWAAQQLRNFPLVNNVVI
jgi:hypothetical protein